MRVLDLGCGKAVISVFLAREFAVQVWATDLRISASDNSKRIADHGMSDSVFPIHADARRLPFAPLPLVRGHHRTLTALALYRGRWASAEGQTESARRAGSVSEFVLASEERLSNVRART